eukprot:3626517-Pyramimonas_sp.AAC.1
MTLKFRSRQQLQNWRAGGLQNVALDLAPRTFVLNKSASVSRMEGEWFSTCGSRLSATHIRFKHVEEFCTD